MAAGDLDDPQFISTLRRDMVRFADLQLRDRAAAEDAVQETLAAALQQRQRFENRASLRTWVLSILKNKIVDTIRLRSRQVQAPADDDDAELDGWFNEHGHWSGETRPAAWGNPEEAVHSQQFWAVLEACLHRLPEAPARAFLMREVMGFDTDEICNTLAITTNNCFVLLHRARLALRACLGERWFAGQPA